MIHAARQRLSNYRLNSGNGVMVWNVLMLVFLAYITWNLTSPVAQLIMGGTIVLSAVLGYAIVPLARWRFQPAVKVMNTARWVGIIIIALNFFNLIPVPLLAVLAGLALIVWSLSASFWLITEPGVLTSRGQEELIRRYGEPEPAHATEPHDDPDFDDANAEGRGQTLDHPGSRRS